MRLFCRTRKPSPEKIRKLAETPLGTNKKACQILGFEGAFCFSMPDIYVSDRVGEILDRFPQFSRTLEEIPGRIASDDYGDVSADDWEENMETRYLACTSWGLIAKYHTQYGCICLEVFRYATLLFLEGENIDALREKYDTQKPE